MATMMVKPSIFEYICVLPMHRSAYSCQYRCKRWPCRTKICNRSCWLKCRSQAKTFSLVSLFQCPLSEVLACSAEIWSTQHQDHHNHINQLNRFNQQHQHQQQQQQHHHHHHHHHRHRHHHHSHQYLSHLKYHYHHRCFTIIAFMFCSFVIVYVAVSKIFYFHPYLGK